MTAECTVVWCHKPKGKARGLCHGHYKRLLRYGDPEGEPTNPPIGETNWNAVLTASNVAEVRSNPDLPLSHFAQKFGVSRMAISQVRRGITWKHLP